ncbi:MAG: hypothetical protein II103_04310, partial [Treponema sp.]|nr:hypothetical protein [Treponema sp.]
MAVITPKVQRIIDWRESMSVMDEEMFFDIMRMYLGELKTPYNKQKLIEGLSSFLRKKENRDTLVSLLGSSDLKILTIVKNIHACTEEKIFSFMEGNLQPSKQDLHEHIINLHERLVLFTFADKSSAASELRINPMLEVDLLPLLQTEILFEQSGQELNAGQDSQSEKNSLQEKSQQPLLPQSACSL